MEFKLVSLKKKNIFERFISIDNYNAVVEYNNKQYKLDANVRKDDNVYDILRRIKYALERQLARDSFDLTLEDIKEYEGKTITKEDYGF